MTGCLCISSCGGDDGARRAREARDHVARNSRLSQNIGAMSPLPRGISVLVVDDEDDVRELVAAILARAGCAVVAAHDGVDALEKLEGGFEPTIIVLDLEMPRLDGEGFLRALHHQRGEWSPRVLVFTAHPFHRPSQAAMCIQKPCTATGLIDAVSTVFHAA